MEKRKAICIIPARGGSKRIPRKNIIDFLGKPLISYSILAIKKAGIADTIMVSTDDEEIASIAKEYGAEIPFYRTAELANDKTDIADVLIDVIERYRKIGIVFEYTICVLASAPLIQTLNLRKAFNILCSEESIDSVCPIEAFSYPPQRCLVVREGKLEMLHPENYFARSQDLEKQYHDCGQFFMFRTEALLRDKKLYTKNAVPFYLSEMESQDIDNYTDLEIAKVKYHFLFNNIRS